jgi:hypothetical protein
LIAARRILRDDRWRGIRQSGECQSQYPILQHEISLFVCPIPRVTGMNTMLFGELSRRATLYESLRRRLAADLLLTSQSAFNLGT